MIKCCCITAKKSERIPQEKGRCGTVKLMNYMNLNQHPARFSFYKDRSREFEEIYHAHQGMEILCVHKGQGTVVVEQQIFDIQPGTVFYFKPFQLHRIRIQVAPGQPYVRSLFVFEPSVLAEKLAPFAGLSAFFRAMWKEHGAVQVFRGLDGSGDWDAFLRSGEALLDSGAPDDRLEEQMLFLVSLVHRLKRSGGAASAERPARGRAAELAEQVMEWLEAHYMEPFELDKLAGAVHLSPNHVSAAFRQSVGSSITEYLTARRIRQACWLLKTSPLSVQEIGRAVGLGNFSYFCQLFKRHVGMTPYQFKKLPAPGSEQRD